MTAANVFVHHVADDQRLGSVRYHILHAMFVSGPLVTFFLAVTYFQIQLQKKLWRLSREDGLTGLNNRRSFFDQTAIARAAKKEGVLMMLDADRFKAINDTYGHQAGDECLKTIAYTIKRNVRQADVVGRIGGEEFAIYLHDTSIRQARAIGERLVKPISFRTHATEPLSVTLSIGVATTCAECSIDDIFGYADHALYQAKQAGRARMVIFDETTAQPLKQGAA
ncbi:GGDEF domain-containing protein [Loktanella sp. Alg231-35]|uniref:GGDEF domain-containing protein n=1 Tax=Loktanella sp. Alg231-35 TaxID=1922220 RepID=UPI001F27D19A|nr:GGDEF domain-containing protein [Loktanella sp. Alg231-35]